jgi:hypothetical protein
MEQAKATSSDKARFEQQYVTTNIRPGAPVYSPEYVARLRGRLLALGEEEWKYYSYAVLVRLPLI